MTEASFTGWAILELMGHRRLGGYISEAEIAGAKFLRIDIPSSDGPPTTQLYGPSAIYSLTPTTEEIAKAVAERNRPVPVYQWELPALRVPAVETEVMSTQSQDEDGDPC